MWRRTHTALKLRVFLRKDAVRVWEGEKLPWGRFFKRIAEVCCSFTVQYLKVEVKGRQEFVVFMRLHWAQKRFLLSWWAFSKGFSYYNHITLWWTLALWTPFLGVTVFICLAEKKGNVSVYHILSTQNIMSEKQENNPKHH